MIDCIYKTENSQCQHKHVHTNKQIVSPKICSVCQFNNTRIIDANKIRNQLPILTEEEKAMIAANPNFKPLGIIEMGANFIKSTVKHVVGGAESVSEETYKERLSTCNSCDQRDGTGCKLCGCNIARKAKWKTNACPIGKWKEVS